METQTQKLKRARLLKWANKGFQFTVEDLKQKVISFKVFTRTTDQKKTGYIA